MEQADKKFKYKCPKHPNFKIEFIQIDNLDASQKDKNLFYCSVCAQTDSTFKLSNHQFIKHIAKSGEDEILPKWPPVRNEELINQLILKTKGSEDIESMIAQIEAYFTDFKDQIMIQVDACKKKMIKNIRQLPFNNHLILNKYQELSKIKELRNILFDNSSDINEMQKKYRTLIENMISQKDQISEQLTSLLNQQQQQQTIFNIEPALQIKDSILRSISKINFFQSLNNKIEQDIQLVKTHFNNGQNCQEIIKNQNNQYEAFLKQKNSDQNIVSNICLDINKRYVFRIQIQMKNNDDCCFVGLIQDININKQAGAFDYLSCQLQQNNNQISSRIVSDWGIQDQVKGSEFKLSKENEIELRVCIGDQVLEVLDFPHYHSKLALQNKYKSKLTNKKFFKLYLGLYELNTKMILKEAFTVHKFE